MQDCIFCKIVKGDMPSYKVFEDDLFIAILDIFPRRKGHTLLIPKKHVKWTYDVEPYDRYWLTARKITRAIEKALKTTFIHHLTYGFHVSHAHIHIIPHFVPIDQEEPFPEIQKISKDELEEIRNKIAAELN